MPDLERFRQNVTCYRKRQDTAAGRPHTQKELAKAIGLSADELGHRLRGSGRSPLTKENVLKIVVTLAEWETLNWEEAVNLLKSMDYPLDSPHWKVELQRYLVSPALSVQYTSITNPGTLLEKTSETNSQEGLQQLVLQLSRVQAISKPRRLTSFISYARNDAREFAQRVYNDLKSRGIEVWLDQREMPSGDTFITEIDHAIQRADYFLLVSTPSAIQSDYCRDEWIKALEYYKPIIPLLLIGDYSDIPEEANVKQNDARDFRREENYTQQMDRLIDQLSIVPRPAARLYGTPHLPRTYIARRTEIEELRRELTKHKMTILTPISMKIGVQGMGGIGKSVIATALARDYFVRRAFPDGIFWLTLGREPPLVQIWARLSAWLGGGSANFVDETDESKAVDYFEQATADHECLIILDDLWESKHANAFIRLGERSRLLVTSRYTNALDEIDAHRYEVGLLSASEAREMLAGYAEVTEQDMPQEAHGIIDTCGKLPLALSMIGAMVRGKPQSYWTDALEALQEADLNDIGVKFPDYPYPSLFASMSASIDVLDDELRERYYDFLIFPDNVSLPETVLLTFWKPLSKRAVRKQIDDLVNRNLLKRAHDGSLTIHDLQLLYIRRQASDPSKRHERLLRGYNPDDKAWHLVSNDGYIYQHLIFHLIAIRDYASLNRLFEDQNWMLRRVQVAQYIYSDYVSDLNAMLKFCAYPRTLEEITSGKDLRTLPDFLRCLLIQTSVNSLDTSLPPQLIKRALELGVWDIDYAVSIVQQLQNIDYAVDIAKAIITTKFDFLTFNEQIQLLHRLIPGNTSGHTLLIQLLPYLANYQKTARALLEGFDFSQSNIAELSAVIPYLDPRDCEGIFYALKEKIMGEIRGSIHPDYLLQPLLPFIPRDLIKLIFDFVLEIDTNEPGSPQFELRDGVYYFSSNFPDHFEQRDRVPKGILPIEQRDRVLEGILPSLNDNELITAWSLIVESAMVNYELLEGIAARLSNASVEQVFGISENTDRETRAFVISALLSRLNSEQHIIVLDDVILNADKISHQKLFEHQVRYFTEEMLFDRSYEAAIVLNETKATITMLTTLARHNKGNTKARIIAYVLEHELFNEELVRALWDSVGDEFIQRVSEYAFENGSVKNLDLAVVLAPKLRHAELRSIAEDMIRRKFMVSGWTEKIAQIAPYLDAEIQLMIIKEGYTVSVYSFNSYLRYLSRIDDGILDLVWNMAKEKNDTASKIQLLRYYNEKERPEKASEVLDEIAQEKENNWRHLHIAEIAGCLNSDLLFRVLGITASLPRTIIVAGKTNLFPRHDAVMALIPFLQPEHISIALNIIDGLVRSERMTLTTAIASLVPESDIVRTIAICSPPKYFSKAIDKLVEKLNNTQLRRAIESVRRIEDDDALVYTLSRLVPYLSLPHGTDAIELALHLALSFRDDSSIFGPVENVELLASMLPHLNSNQKNQILDKALSIASQVLERNAVDTFPQNRVMVSIIPYFEKEKRKFLVGNMLAIVDRVQNAWEWHVRGDSYAMAMVTIAKVAEDEYIQKCLEVALSRIGRESLPFERYTLDIISAVAPRLDEALAGQALSISLQIPDELERTSCLVSIVPRLRRDLMETVVDAALTISDADQSLHLLATTLPHLSDTRRNEVANTIVGQLDRISSDTNLAKIVAEVVPFLEQTKRLEITKYGFEAAVRIANKSGSISALEGYIELEDRATEIILLTMVNSLNGIINSPRRNIFSLIANHDKFLPAVIPQHVIDAVAISVLEITQRWQWV